MLEFKNELNSIKDLDFLYSSLGWNKVGLSNVELANMWCRCFAQLSK